MIADLATIFIKAFLIDNVVLLQFIALCPFIGMSTDTDKAVGMGVAVCFVTILATAVTWPIYTYILMPGGIIAPDLTFLQTLVFIVVIASLVQLVEFFLKKSAPALYSAMGVYLALITTNCAILAVTIDSISNQFTYLESIIYAIGVAMGFMLALVLMSGVRKRLKSAPIPPIMKGTPILFMASAFMAMALNGFAGLIK
jgi:electron transport complex protein RnfA